MEPFTISLVSGLTVNLTTSVLNAAGRKFRDSIKGTEKEQAISRCLNAGVVALLASATTQVKEEIDLLENIFRQFFEDADVAKELAVLLRAQPLNRDELKYLFEHSGFDTKTLKGLDIDNAITQFEAAFIAAATAEPTLQDTIQVNLLIHQTGIQHELLTTMKEMHQFLQQAHLENLGIQDGQINAIDRISGKMLAFRLLDAKTDKEGDHGISIKGDALRTSYVNHIFEATHYLSLAGIDPKAASDAETRLKLDAVYMALFTLSTEAHERWQRGEMVEKDTKRFSALEQLNRHQHLVLLGDPGSGKSTFVNFVALCLAGEALARKDANLSLLTAPIPEKDEKEQKPQPWDHGSLIPIRVILRDFAARGLPKHGTKATAQNLWDFIAGELEAATLGDYSDYLRSELLEKGGLLLIDGMDEVPEADRKREQIKQAVEDFAAAYPRCRVLITSRTYAYQKQDWRLPDFAETILAPFSQVQINLFVDRWYAHIGSLRGLHQDDARGRAELLKRAITGSDRLASLAERPLLLTLMASLHAWRGGSLPEKREELYADTIDLLLDWWQSGKTVHDADGKVKVLQPSLAEWLKIDRQKVRDLLNELAFNAHISQPDLVGTADVPEPSLTNGLMHISQNPDVKPARLLEFLRDRAGLLLPRGIGVYTFPHRTFQEYLAACYLTDHDYPDKLAEMVCADPNRWREVALLAGAKAARGAGSTIWLLVDALCHHKTEDKLTCLISTWCAHLAGQALVESADLSKVSKPNQQKLDLVKDWLVHIMRFEEFPANERALAGDNLCQLGDPRPKMMSLDNMQFCYVPAGDFWMGSPDEDDMAWDDEKPLHKQDVPQDYWISRYPITNAQFQQFVDDPGGYQNDDWWTADGLAWRSDRTAPDKQGGAYDFTNHPVVMARWYEAVAFTRWLSNYFQQTKMLSKDWQIRLPSEAEWEKAARGREKIPKKPLIISIKNINLKAEWEAVPNEDQKRRYPWGNEPDPNRANYNDTGIGNTSAIGCFPGGASVYGCEEMSGNVLEWCSTKWRDDYNQKPDDNLKGDSPRVVRGGSFGNNRRGVRCAYRLRDLPDYWFNLLGFRVVLSPF